MMDNKSVVFLGHSGFPFGMAAIQRQLLLSKALEFKGINVIILCRRSIHPETIKIKQVGHFEDIKFIYVHNPHREKKFVIRNFKKLVAPVSEYLLMRKLSKRYNLSYAIVSNRNLVLQIIQYYIYSKVFKFKVFLNYVEIYKGRKNSKLGRIINDWLFNKIGLIFFDGYFPISDEIIKASSRFKKPHHYLPVIVDTEKFKPVFPQETSDYFTYCGAAAYFDSIRFIIDSFLRMKNKQCRLFLVTNGSIEEMQKIHKKISESNLADRIVITSNLSTDNLNSLFSNSLGLLLPLFDTIQDNARFPHKLGEYLASGRIVLSNPVGEIKKFLNHKESVLFSSASDIESFSANMDWVVNHEKEANQIGEIGRLVCLKEFDYKNLSNGIITFLNNYER